MCTDSISHMAHIIGGNMQDADLGRISQDVFVTGNMITASATVPAGEHVQVVVSGNMSEMHLDGQGSVAVEAAGPISDVTIADSLEVTEAPVSGKNTPAVGRHASGDFPRDGQSFGPDGNATDVSVTQEQSQSVDIDAANADVDVSVSQSQSQSSTGTTGGSRPQHRPTTTAAAGGDTGQPTGPAPKDSPTPAYVAAVADDLSTRAKRDGSVADCSKHLNELRDALLESRLGGRVYEEILEDLEALVQRIEEESLPDDLDETRVREITDIAHRAKRLCQRRS